MRSRVSYLIVEVEGGEADGVVDSVLEEDGGEVVRVGGSVVLRDQLQQEWRERRAEVVEQTDEQRLCARLQGHTLRRYATWL